MISQISLDFIESYLYDIRVRTKISRSTTDHLELVYVTPKTVEKLKGMPGPATQIEFLKKLLAAQPKAVVVDYDILDTTGTPQEWAALQDFLLQNPTLIIASRSASLSGDEKQLFMRAPLNKVRTKSEPKTTDSLNFAKDGVTRRMMMAYQGRPMLQVQLAGLFNPDITNVQNVKGHFSFYETDQGYINYRPPRTFPSRSYEDVLEGTSNLSDLQNKIVLVGTDLNIDEAEYVETPYSRVPTAMTRIEMQANVIDTLIGNSGPMKAPAIINWLWIFIISLLTIHVVFSMKPTQGLLALAAALATFLVISYVAFCPFGWWMNMAQPLLTVFLCYYFFIPYRLIVENRRSWEYYQKNKLLSQVEELKTNFISMMSHDLKTPIARIQGMTNVILSDTVALSSQQREAVDTIRHSSDDLLKFINAILNYGRIESQGVQLNLQSKDINTLLMEVVRKHEFLAKLKRIQIIPELEPLFPVPVDPELIKQILSNLVENAIKYSPEDTKIMVSTEEANGKIVIQVADQGQGIPADEIGNIFMKFFRSKNAKSSPIKGSGLGLYLAQYFTELHHGRIFVESTYGHGSTFTVELPLEQRGNNA